MRSKHWAGAPVSPNTVHTSVCPVALDVPKLSFVDQKSGFLQQQTG